MKGAGDKKQRSSTNAEPGKQGGETLATDAQLAGSDYHPNGVNVATCQGD